MREAFILLALMAFLISLAPAVRAEHYLNQTKEERPRKKKKVKGFDYEKSRYFNQSMDPSGYYIYEEGVPVAEKEKKKAKKAKPKDEEGKSAEEKPAEEAPAPEASLGETKAKPAFKRVASFSEQGKTKGRGANPTGISPEEAMKAAQAAQAKAGQAQGGGQWQNFNTGPQTGSGYGQGQPGQVKVMP